MKTLVSLAGLFVLQFSNFVAAHEEMMGPLETIEKTYGAPAPIGRIVVRYDGRTEAAPKLHLHSNLFRGAVPQSALRNLPRPQWEDLTVPYALTSFDAKTRKFIKRPYLYISVPLLGPAGQAWPTTAVHFAFNDRGQLAGRRLQLRVPVKAGRVVSSTTEADAIHVIQKDWPFTSRDSAEAVFNRALDKLKAELSTQ